MQKKKEKGFEMVVNILVNIGMIASMLVANVVHWLIKSYGWVWILIWHFFGIIWAILAWFIYWTLREAGK